MGPRHSKIDIKHNPHEQIRCNYNCPTCKQSGKVPNIEGRFIIINDKECQCNACFSIFNKSIIYQKLQI